METALSYLLMQRHGASALLRLPRRRGFSTATDRGAASFSSPSSSSIPVVIVGGGPTGLLLSTLLSSYGVRSVLLERRSESDVFRHPQAHFLNLRTMEVLRHAVPSVYREVVDATPDVSEWESFRFGRSVLGRTIGRVVHPVRGGLSVGQDGNGILIEEGSTAEEAAGSSSTRRCSACAVAHLAQNRFASILLDAARDAASSVPGGGSDILYSVGDAEVFDAEGYDMSSPLVVRTASGQSYSTQYVAAADGANSPTRQKYGVEMAGDPALQHLINIHFRASPELSRRLSSEKDRAAMLHFVYHEKIVGAFVCHDLRRGEWVTQVPFFPPHQTVEEGFAEDKVRDMVLAGLGVDNGDSDGDIEILSIRPWTMSATVAQTYLAGSSGRIILAGDAAHAFPPAGGFGMNTGLQDAHNLAWRLALALRASGGKDAKKDTQIGTDTRLLVHGYESDRKPVAAQNAALSVRNYNRTLNLARACYLDADHPALLASVMSAPPASLLPSAARRLAFDGLVRAAMFPLASLGRRGNPHGERIARNFRAILRSGGGLPLLFPRYELGFWYGDGDDNAAAVGLGENDDTAGYVPRLAAGHRLPHVAVEVVMPPADDSDDTFGMVWQGSFLIEEKAWREDAEIPSTNSHRRYITLTDITSQLRVPSSHCPPGFVVLVTGSNLVEQSTILRDTVERLSMEIGIIIDVVEMFTNRNRALKRWKSSKTARGKRIPRILLDENSEFSMLLRNSASIASEATGGELDPDAMVLVRPDGHVATVLWFKDLGGAEDGRHSSPIPPSVVRRFEEAVRDGLTKTIGSIKIKN